MLHLKLIKDNSILYSFAILNDRMQLHVYGKTLTFSLLASERAYSVSAAVAQLLYSPVSVLVNSKNTSAGAVGCFEMSWSDQ